MHNTYYNPNGNIAPRAYTFPYADESFDLVFAASVFTHMLPEAAANYFSYRYGDYGDQFAIVVPDNPEHMTAFRSDLIERFAKDAALKFAQAPVPGLWSGATPTWVGAQDLVVLEKSRWAEFFTTEPSAVEG